MTTTPPPDSPDGSDTTPAPAAAAPDTATAPTPARRRGIRFKLLLLSLLLVPVLFLVLYTAVMLNYAYSAGSKAGYLQRFESRGWLCKTNEGELLITSAPGVPTETWAFSVRDDAVAEQLRARVGQRVLLFYEEHRGLPTDCFGATTYFVDSVGATTDGGR